MKGSTPFTIKCWLYSPCGTRHPCSQISHPVLCISYFPPLKGDVGWTSLPEGKADLAKATTDATRGRQLHGPLASWKGRHGTARSSTRRGGEKPSLPCMQHSCQRAICGGRTWGPSPTRSSCHRQGSMVGPAGFTVLTEGLPPGPSSLRHPLAGHSTATRTCERLVAGPLDTLIGREPGRGPAMSLTGTSDARGGEVSGALEPGAPDRCLQDKERLWCIQPLCLSGQAGPVVRTAHSTCAMSGHRRRPHGAAATVRVPRHFPRALGHAEAPAAALGGCAQTPKFSLKAGMQIS